MWKRWQVGRGAVCRAGCWNRLFVVRALDFGWIIFSNTRPKGNCSSFGGLVHCLGQREKARIYLCDKTYDLALNVLVGLGLAFGSIAAAVLAGTIVGFLGEADHILRAENFSASGLVLFPRFLVVWFGGIPAILLGVFYVFVVQNRFAPVEPVVGVLFPACLRGPRHLGSFIWFALLTAESPRTAEVRRELGRTVHGSCTAHGP